MNGDSITIDKGLEIPQYSPVCSFCRHADRSMLRRCAAFAGDIPLEIWTGENTHRAPFPGDGGTTFAWADDVAPAVRANIEAQVRQ